jgi:hypothetical protein
LVIAPYTITFENGTYQVKLAGGTNTNFIDRLNGNNVSVIPANSAGLQIVTVNSGTVSGVIGEPLNYRADTATGASDPGAGRLRWNNATQSSATELYIDILTDGGTDISSFLPRLYAGNVLYIQDKDDATKKQTWLLSTTTDNTGWWTFAVTNLTAAGGNIANNQEIVVVATLDATSAGITQQQVRDAMLLTATGGAPPIDTKLDTAIAISTAGL